MRLNSPRTRGCATSQTTLVAVALLTFLGAGVLWSVSGKTSRKSPRKPAQHTDGVKNRVVTAQSLPEATLGLQAQAQPEAQRGKQTAPVALAASVKARGLSASAKLPLAFEPNQGQTDPQAAYVARGSGYCLFLTPTEAVLSLARGPETAPETAAVRMQLEGASAAVAMGGTEPLPGKVNYLRGNDPSRWVRNVPTYAQVKYQSVYSGIDLVFYGKQGQLEYDFDVRSGADPSQIRLNLSGVDSLALAPDGSLVLKTAARDVRWNKPVIYQEVNGQRRAVDGGFQLLADNRVGFTLGRYDRGRDLVIDPILSFATYFGGSSNELNPQVAVDGNSNIYLAGTTSSATGFPVCVTTTTNVCPLTPPAPTLDGPTDVFVSKLDPLGSSVLYTTYMNGKSLTPPVALTPYGDASGIDSSAGLAVDNQGNAYITGSTNSADFPVTTNAFQTTRVNSLNHVFVSKLDPTGANLLYSTYLSGSNTDTAMAIAADSTGDAYILGWTQSVTAGDFPTGNSFQQSAKTATRLYFVAKFDTTQATGPASLKFFSYLGGTLTNPPAPAGDGVVCAQLPCGGIALDTTGDAYVAVGTTFTDMAVVNAYQATNHGGSDAFAAKISPDGSALLYASYLGGIGNDTANAIALDTSGDAYLTGSTTSTDFPSGTTPVVTTLSGPQDAYLAKFNNATTGPIALTFTTYIGGSGTETGYAIVADVNQNAYIVGSTNSSNFPAPGGTLATDGPSADAFLVKYNSSATALLAFISSNLLGGTGTDRATSVAQNVNGAVLVAGETNSGDFPVKGPLQSTLNGTSDAFLADYGPSTDLSLAVTVAPTPAVAIGAAATFTYTVTNHGPDYSTGAVLSIVIPGPESLGGTLGAFSSGTNSCVTTGASPNQVEICTLGTIAANSSTAVTVPVTPAVFTSGSKSGTIPLSVTMRGRVFPGNTAQDPTPGNNESSAATTVEYFTSAVSPSSVSVVAGKTATYTVTVSPNSTAGFPANISFTCTPQSTPVALTNTTCTFTPTPITTIPKSTGSATSVLKVTTTASTQTGALRRSPTFWYALWLPLCGVALFGAGSSRRRRWMTGAAVVVLLGTIAWLPACGSKSSGTTTTGTQPGTYNITITSTSGTYTYPPTTSPLNVSLTVTAN